jgi:glyoxylase-like metal-dependent hydrolase (beta-lactamase superfamily II)
VKHAVVPVTPFQQNCSVIWDETTMAGAVVDPGGDLDRVMAEVERNGVRLERILVTHGHLDHAGATAALATALKLPVEGPHPDDKFWIDGMPQQAVMFRFSAAQPFTPDRWLDQGDRVSLGSLTLDVLHCPGHTPGHVVFFHAPSKLALVGDVLFRGSVGRSDFPRGDHATLIRSIRERLLPLGDDVTFIPGHGPLSTFGHERRFNPFLKE